MVTEEQRLEAAALGRLAAQEFALCSSGAKSSREGTEESVERHVSVLNTLEE